MYESIERYTQDYVLYVLCMDDRCFEILTDLNRPRFIPIKLSDFESPELLAVKSERSMGEYCWTCSSCLVDFVMRTFNPEYCAYIDSDLYFYDDVNVVVKEMQERNASVMITGHRFNWYDRKEMERLVGKYCVEFNTFKNDANGRSLLSTWKRQCLEYCKCDGDGIHWADQKYLDNWCEDYSFCLETENFGAGIAQWNIAQYKMISNDENGPVKVKCNGKIFQMLFFHFQNLNYIDATHAESHTACYWGVDYELVHCAYSLYLKHIQKNKNILKSKYDVFILLKEHPGITKRCDISIVNYLKKIIRIKHLPKSMKALFFNKIPAIIHRNDSIIEFS